MEPPSNQLLQTLQRLKLTQPRDLRRCRGQVKRLARDLPAFDSVWIDALLKKRFLTPFQAACLESNHPDRLAMGDYLLVDQLSQGKRSTTFLATDQKKRHCVLKELSHNNSAENLYDAQHAIETFATQLAEVKSSYINGPQSAFIHDERLIIVSDYVQGTHLKDLLIRRGRFPAQIVEALFRQIVEGLFALENRKLLHGHLQLSKLRLSATGQVVLVDTGINMTLQPQFTIRADLPPEKYDTIAPELVHTGNPPSVASDMYALGCILWQLLAGRPPFPTGDPLSKLAAHQTKVIDDVRKWAPETPAVLAELIQVMTSSDPAMRPAAWHDVREKMGAPRHHDKQQLKQFSQQFRSAVKREQNKTATTPRSLVSSRWAMLFASLLLLTGMTLTLIDEGARARTLAIWNDVSEASLEKLSELSNTETAQAKPNNNIKTPVPTPEIKKSKWLPLPTPDADGIIHLPKNGPYEAANISTVGTLRIRGAAGKQPRIRIETKAFSIWAEQLILENVHFEYAPEETETLKQPAISAMLLVQSQDVAILKCSFGQLKKRPAPVAVAWKPIDDTEQVSRRINISNTVFNTSGDAIYLAASPRSCQATNCLKLGTGSLFLLGAAPQVGKTLRVRLNRLTLRGATSLLDMRFSKDVDAIGQTIIDTQQSVIQLARENSALFQFTAASMNNNWLSTCEVTGEGTLTGNSLRIAQWRSESGEINPITDENQIALEGLLGGSFKFRAPLSSNPTASTLTEWQAPLRSAKPPGIDAKLLPVFDE